MSTTTKEIETQITSRRRSFPFSGLALRLLIAFIISWVIVMAFFISGAVSR
ncbi:MAG: hypothetical protein ACRDIV_09695 [Ktedonobacteraceae bacterium]